MIILNVLLPNTTSYKMETLGKIVGDYNEDKQDMCDCL